MCVKNIRVKKCVLKNIRVKNIGVKIIVLKMVALKFILDRNKPIRQQLDENAPPILPEHQKILEALWPKGDKANLYRHIPSVRGRPSLYKSMSKIGVEKFSHRSST